MAKDIFLGKSRRNWARGVIPSSLVVVQVAVTDEVELRLTPAEMANLAELASLKMKADAGDRSSQKKLVKVSREIARLRSKARQGDAKAQRALKVFEESGVFRGTQSFTLGGEETVSNLQYRACVLKNAMKSAKMSGRRAPTTKDFFVAKKTVDKTMADSGIALWLPGSRPGRVTY
jgi:hypothetical protein